MAELDKILRITRWRLRNPLTGGDYTYERTKLKTTGESRFWTREDRPSSGMVLTVTEDTPADMLAGSMDLLVQLPREHHVHTQRVTVQRSTPMMDLLVQIATAHKLAASSYTLQAIGERGLVLPHQPNTPIGALDALQVKLLPKQGTFVPRKTRQANQPFETTFRLQVHLPRNQLYVSRVSPKMNLGEILEEVCREKNLDRNKYELRHPANLEEVLDLSSSLQDYHLQEVTLYAKQGRALGSALSSQDIMALQRQEERRRQQTKQGVFGFMFKKSKDSSLSTDSLGGRSVSPARSDETGRSASPLAPPARPLRKRRPAPKPPVLENGEVSQDNSKEKIVISHSRNSSDSSGYHEASVLSDNPDSNTRIPETLPRRSKVPGNMDSPRKLAQTSQASKSLGNLAAASGGLSHGVSNTSLSSTDSCSSLRKKRTAPAPPPPPMARPLSSAISTQGLERIVDSEESLTSDMDISKPPSDIGAASSKANSDIDVHSNANSGVAMNSVNSRSTAIESKVNSETRLVPDVIPNCVKTSKTDSEMVEKTKPELKAADKNIPKSNSEIVPAPSVPRTMNVATARVEKRAGGLAPIPKPRETSIPGSIKSANSHALQCSESQPLPAPRTRSESTTSLDSLPSVQESVNISKSVGKMSTKSLDTIASNDTRTALPCSNVRKSEAVKSEVSLDSREISLEKTRDEAKDIYKKDSFDDEVQVSSNRTKPEELVASPGPINCGRVGRDKFDDKKQESVALGTGDKRTIVTVKSAEVSVKGQEETKEGKKHSERKAPEKPRRRTLEIAELNIKKDPGEENNENKASKPVLRGSVMEFKKDNFSQESSTSIEGNKETMENIVKRLGPGKAIRKTCSMKQLHEKWENRKLPSGGDSLKHAKSMDDIYGICTRKESGYIRKKNSMQTRSCAVISTIPKCEHIAPKWDDDVRKITKHNLQTEKPKSKSFEHPVNVKGSLGLPFDAGESIVHCSLELDARKESFGLTEDELANLENIGMLKRDKKMPKRMKIFRSHSDLNNFEINTFGRHPRYLTAYAEDFAGVLNTNLTTNVLKLDEKERKDHKDLSNEDSTSNEYIGSSQISISGTEFPSFMTHGTHFADWQDIQNLKDDAEEDTTIIGQSDNEDGPMQTDVLLRKVSDTLSGSLVPPPQPPTMPPDSSCSSLSGSDEAQSAAKRNPVDILLSEATETLNETIESTKKIENAVKLSQVKIKQSNLSPAQTILRSSTPNLTLSSSQQDTSDYVSAGGDDLSITDWEYQLPAPPSAFRDNDSPAFNDYETITLGSVEAFKEPIARIVDKTDAETKNENNLTITNKTATKSSAVSSKAKHVKPIVDVTPPTVMDKKSFTRQISTESRGSDASLELKKEVISELENRIETGRLSQSNIKHSETDSRRASEISSTPTLAPVDNTLSNFTITTYSGQRSLNIFDEAEQQQQQQQSDDKTVKSFATLNRSRTISENSNGSIQSPRSSTARERDFVQTKTLPANGYDGQESLEQTEFLKPVPKSLKHESLPSSQSFGNDDEKSSNLHKSKSYISWVNNTKVRTGISGEEDSMNSMTYDSIDNSGEPIRKSVSINNLSQDTSRGNEKFSQWRENILKRQEEPTKEKQLQSLQVLKNILPKLKNSQQTDENVIEQSRNKVADEQITKVVSSIEHSTESSVDSNTADSKLKAESEMQKVRTEESSGKRFSYSGPPAISLGSWSERPCVNVQIKMDTDYKFGKSNTSGAKTVVNLNGTRDEADYVKFNGDAGSTLPRKVVKSNFIENEMSTELKKSENKEKEELANKLITHTTPSGFKRPALNKIGFPEGRSVPNNEDKPIVTAMELKKTDADKNDPPRNQKQQEDDDDDIDTRPVKFEELTKAFGQEVTRRAKPKHIVQNRHSDYYGSKPEIITNFIKSDINQNGFAHSNKVAPKQVEPVRNNSVVSNEINNDAQNIPIKKYTSVIGINSQGAHFANQNGNFAMKNRSSSIKINGPMPVVKGFKIQASEIEPKVITAPARQNGFSVVNGPKKLSQTPQPPTMPVITGVTLKSNSARPKSMPLQKDSRDDLLESIRNFGGRDKLKTATGRRY
ncbi:uncharacterized protein LOC107266363 isoform X1 [Cephus cinctus]|uniref:Uncharacterized protein LOC107266363 isoform X1 n=1 Tax=Cephus cinctus TaxID=211228 RepID=A0AAJ7REK6_CEPCN|nr:uncharacterized protein LOC107266363 isoform X1 [Cephus cinctus]